jgi:hypothetical protein
MIKNTALIPFLLLIFFFRANGQVHVDYVQFNVIAELEKISDVPTPLSFQNRLQIANTGGHLQGIQALNHQGQIYYIVSGSSDSQSYYSIIKSGTENFVVAHNTILEKPFKHAGGFQIYENLMAIGVEDNDKKDKSKVFIFQMDNPERPPVEPLAIIDRIGTEKRATAGCVAITDIGGKILVIVGDWDTINLDFYLIDREKLGLDPEALELEYSLNTRKMDKSAWIDEEWLSYQNINLIHGDDGQIYLAGMTTNASDQDVLDLYQVLSSDLKTFRLLKVYSKKVGSNPITRFRWGAGIHISNAGKIQLLSTPENISDQSIIHMYE